MRCLLGLADSIDELNHGLTDGQVGGDFLASGVIPQFGDYELVEELARGGMGVVYRAKQRSLNRVVAVKMILVGHLATPELVQRFRVEAEAAARMNHPGIVPIYEIGEHQTQHYFSMHLVEGGNLAARMDEFALHTEMTAIEAKQRQIKIAKFITKAAHAMEYAHEHGVLHRDLKPTNILIDEQGDPQVTDFGLAKLIGPGATGSTVTAGVLGSPSYMAPEQALGKPDEVTTVTDVYGLGAVFYELLTKRPPFVAATPMATMRQVMDDPPPTPGHVNSRVHPDLATIAMKCLEKNPHDRYSSATALAADLERFIDGRPIRARPISASQHVLRWCLRNPSLAILASRLDAGGRRRRVGDCVSVASCRSRQR